MTPARRVNLRDIAEAAGVSMQTASRVVRGVDAVAQPTRERVLDAVRRLNYQPNLAARSLSGRRTGSIHIIVAVRLLHGHASTFVGICEALAELQLGASVSIVPQGEDPKLSVTDLVPLGADGAVVIGGISGSTAWLEDLADRMPLVYVGQIDGLPATASSVRIDQGTGARQATELLIDRGAERPVHVAGPLGWIDADLRRQSFEDVCRERGLEGRVVVSNGWDAADGSAAMEGLEGDFDGVFAANDSIALAALSVVLRDGRSVPQDVRVIGFDDATDSASLHPALTTVRQDFSRVGQEAVQQMQHLLNGLPPRETVIETQLIIRETC